LSKTKHLSELLGLGYSYPPALRELPIPRQIFGFPPQQIPMPERHGVRLPQRFQDLFSKR
jgi:hypothetical protein